MPFDFFVCTTGYKYHTHTDTLIHHFTDRDSAKNSPPELIIYREASIRSTVIVLLAYLALWRYPIFHSSIASYTEYKMPQCS